MPPTPEDAKQIVSAIRFTRWFAQSWMILPVAALAIAIFVMNRNISWTFTYGFTVVLVLLFYGIIVLANVGHTKSLLIKYLQHHDSLVCPKDCSPATAEPGTDTCSCPTCKIEIDPEILREFWTDTLATDSNWLRWLLHQKRALAELPYTDPSNPNQTIRLDSDAIASRVSHARLLEWSVAIYTLALLLLIVTGGNWVPQWLARTVLYQLIALYLIWIPASWMASRAKASLRKYIRKNHALICPKDFYPLVETHPGYEFVHCPECGMSTSKTECRIFWQQTLGGKYRWLGWLFFNRPRINQNPPAIDK